MSGVYRQTSLRLPEDLWRLAKQVVLDHRIQGGVTGLIRQGLENEIAALKRIPLDFEAQFRRAHGREPSWEERIACYGGALPISDPKPGHYTHYSECFTLSELVEHYVSRAWNERTAQLVREQRQIWRERGMKTLQQPLFPPGWKPRPAEATQETATPDTPEEHDFTLVVGEPGEGPDEDIL